MREKIYSGCEDLEKEELIENYERLITKGMRFGSESQDTPSFMTELIGQLKGLITTQNAGITDDNYISAARLGTILDHVGLPSDSIINDWTKAYSGVDLDIPQQIHRRNYQNIINYLTILSLELNEANSAKVLYEEFGIRTFGRYSPKFLLDQFNNRDNRDIPYGVVFFPRADHNGAFYSSKFIFDNLSDKLEGDYALRAFEVGSKLDLVKSLLKADERYGLNETDGHQISFGILGGHGSDVAVYFDEGSHLSTLDTYFKDSRWDERLSTVFEDDATLILFSCSAGSEGGIAQQLCDALKITVIAPEADSYAEKCDIEIGNSLTFDVQYAGVDADVVKTITYHPGESRKRVHLDLSLEKESDTFNREIFRVIRLDQEIHLHT